MRLFLFFTIPVCLTYIIYSTSLDSYYVGHTCDDMHERLRRHNAAHAGFTGKVNDWIVVFTQEFITKKEALERENQIKRWKSRKRIQSLISGT